MRQTVSLTSTYSSDEFGICSALFELGGMVVMHDASGCNSTYTTHDEPRWYDMDSMIFISAISEMEAIMGDDDKLIRDLIETANDLHPAFIAIVGAPIPYMIGTDLEAIAMITEQETGIPCMAFAANGMNHYTKGISMALDTLVKRYCTEDMNKTEECSVNIIGATPLDFCVNGSVEAIRQWCEEHDMQVNCCMAMGDTLNNIKYAGRAHLNLVLSYGGLAAARYLEERYEIPYVVGVPFGSRYSEVLAGHLREALNSGQSFVSYQKIERTGEPKLAILGESVYCASLAAAIELEYGIGVRMLTPLDTEASLLRKGDVIVPDEDDIVGEIRHVEGLIADPLYKPLITAGKKFYELPHEAFSGRIYDNVNPNLIGNRLEKITC